MELFSIRIQRTFQLVSTEHTEQQKQENINIQGSGVMPDSRHVIHPRVM